MPISVPCPACRAVLRAPEGAAGRKAKCPKCGETFAIPAKVVAPVKEAPRPKAKTTRLAPKEAVKTRLQPTSVVPDDEEVAAPVKDKPRPRTKAQPAPAKEAVTTRARPARVAPVEEEDEKELRPPSRAGKGRGKRDEEDEDRPRRKQRDEEEDEDRPRLKKKRKKGSPVLMYVGLGVGALLMLVGVIFLVIGLTWGGGDDKSGQGKKAAGANPANNAPAGVTLATAKTLKPGMTVAAVETALKGKGKASPSAEEVVQAWYVAASEQIVQEIKAHHFQDQPPEERYWWPVPSGGLLVRFRGGQLYMAAFATRQGNATANESTFEKLHPTGTWEHHTFKMGLPP